MANLRLVEFDDDEEPTHLTVRLTTNEAIAIYAFLGYVAPVELREAFGNDVTEAASDAAECLSGAFFNRYWEEGASHFLPHHRISIDLR